MSPISLIECNSVSHLVSLVYASVTYHRYRRSKQGNLILNGGLSLESNGPTTFAGIAGKDQYRSTVEAPLYLEAPNEAPSVPPHRPSGKERAGQSRAVSSIYSGR